MNKLSQVLAAVQEGLKKTKSTSNPNLKRLMRKQQLLKKVK